ncbi:MAG: hypothetical protein PHC61_12050 [Chitinivibrionales bacterium]|nr:hypothetical protein [Chitinivibrionales bacterium]
MQFPLIEQIVQHLPGFPVKRLILAAVILALCASWFNAGFPVNDEHYQILEFAWYKMGHAPAKELAWEFNDHIRAGLQPALALGVFKALKSFDLFTPFLAAYLLRLVSTLLGFWVSLLMLRLCLPWIEQAWCKRALFLGTFFLWFNLFLHARFSSENWSGVFFFGGLCVCFNALQDGSGRKYRNGLRALATGFLLGISFYFRFQMAFGIVGLGLWLLLIARIKWRMLFLLSLSFLAAVALNILIDRWFYGFWAFTPYDYFAVNLLQGKVATFGANPWWYYIVQFLYFFIPPFSLAFLALVIAAFFFQKRNVLVWIAAPFILGHCFIGHKEMRFLYPLSYLLAPLLALSLSGLPSSWQTVMARWVRSIPGRCAVVGFVTFNVILLVIFCFKPARETDMVFRWLYDKGNKNNFVLYTFNASPYRFGPLFMHFYRAPDITVKKIATKEELLHEAKKAGGPVYLFSEGLRPADSLLSTGAAIKPVIQTIPHWLTYFNINNWLSRIRIWTIYSISL